MMKYIYTTILLLSISLAGSAQWTMNTFVNVEAAGVNAADLQTATTTDGRTWIAFYSNNAGNYDMRAQLLDAGGNKLLGPDGMLVCSQPSGSATFVFNVCLDASNNLIIAFQYQVAGNNTAVITKVNTDGSLPWGANGVQLGAGLAPYPVVLTTGEPVVAWNNSSPSTLYIQKLSAAGSPVWGVPVPVTVGASLTTRGQLVANPGGNFTMVFQRKGVGISTTLFAQRYNNDGLAQWASAVQLSTRTTSGARYYSIIVEADTTYFGYYAASGSRFFSHVQRINPNGTVPWGENGADFSTYSTGADPYQQTTNIAHAPNSPYVWGVCTYTNTSQSQSGVYLQKFSTATGAALLDPLGKQIFPITTQMNQQTGKLTLASDDPVFMFYNSDYQIYATRLDLNGGFVWPGDYVGLSSTTATLATPKGRFAFTDMINNQVVAVWYENRVGEYRPYAQQINAFGVIPVTLTDFRGTRNGKKVDLLWNTSSESNNKGFYIERSTDGINYITLSFVASKAPGGNSSVNMDYVFSDIQPMQSYNYYRLKQVNFDDKFTYSKTVMVRFDKQGTIFISNIYPAPASTVLHASVESAIKTNGIISIVDMNGKVIKNYPVSLNTGSDLLDVDISSIAKGMYILRIVADGVVTNSEKWIKQ